MEDLISLVIFVGIIVFNIFIKNIAKKAKSDSTTQPETPQGSPTQKGLMGSLGDALKKITDEYLDSDEEDVKLEIGKDPTREEVVTYSSILALEEEESDATLSDCEIHESERKSKTELSIKSVRRAFVMSEILNTPVSMR